MQSLFYFMSAYFFAICGKITKTKKGGEILRRSGILLPVFSLSGKYGTGTLGKSAYDFVDFLSASGQSIWQTLPLTPTSYGNSPYQSPSVFAGNPYFIDPDDLYTKGLIGKSDLEAFMLSDCDSVNYSFLYKTRSSLLKKAASKISDSDSEYLEFKEKESFWLEKFAVFTALKEKNHMRSHHYWKYKSAEDIAALKNEISTHSKIQYLFYSQWLKLKKYANDKGITIVGDLPVYPAEDSSDYYFSPQMFLKGRVAACPPDSFNANGQLWGNPVYDWQQLKESNYSWWKKRIANALRLYDSIRIDHFRGFYEYYSTDDGKPATQGKWSPGPGLDFCRMVKETFPSIDIIAEDLGFLTEDTRRFFRESGFDGMKVLIFAFDGDNSEYLPHNHIKNSVVYTGTHDTPTVLGWICQTDSSSLNRAMDYLGASSVYTLSDCFIRGAFSSVADRAVIPMQDWLKIGSAGRINTPGTAGRNWQWRMKEDFLSKNLSEKILSYTKIYNRIQEEQQ